MPPRKQGAKPVPVASVSVDDDDESVTAGQKRKRVTGTKDDRSATSSRAERLGKGGLPTPSESPPSVSSGRSRTTSRSKAAKSTASASTRGSSAKGSRTKKAAARSSDEESSSSSFVDEDDDGYESSSSSFPEASSSSASLSSSANAKKANMKAKGSSNSSSSSSKRATPAKPAKPASSSKATATSRLQAIALLSSSESSSSEDDQPVRKQQRAPQAVKPKPKPKAAAAARTKTPPAKRVRRSKSSGSEAEFALRGSSSPSSESSATSTSGSESDSESSSSGAGNGRTTGGRNRASPQHTEARRKKLEEARRKRDATTRQKVEKFHPELKTVWEAVDLTAAYDHKSKKHAPQAEQPPELKMRLLPFQLEGVAWMRRQEQSEFGGGILADEMGMGKTIQTIGLLLTQPRLAPNLILTPTVALMQWQDEILRHTLPNTLKVLIYHGSERPTSIEELSEYDVVLSTYSIVESGFRKQQYGFKRKGQMVKEKSVLHSIDWKRVVLDEAHSIKDRSCSTARAVFALQCEKKWCLSGTPLQNRVGELYSLLRFLKTDPFSYYFCQNCDCKSLSWAFSDRRNCDDCGHKPMSHFCWWNREILKPIQNYGGDHEDGRVAFRKLSHLLDKIMLRRTKLERAEDLGLPPRVVVVRRDLFNEEEDDLYNSLYGDARRKFDTYVAEDRVLNNYANIFELLMRMRQASNHPDLVTKKGLVASNEKVDTLVCGICQEPAEDAIMSKCKHTFCREDIQQYILSSMDPSPKCPVCFRTLNIDLSQPEIQPADSVDTDRKMRSSIINYLDMSRWRSSTKIEALVEELNNLRAKDATIKSIVFSQFVNFLDLVHWRLQRSGFTCVKLDGRMGPQQRANIIAAFNSNPKITVFLISLKAGGIALNLTEASTVFMMDPWWNPAVEDQAMDRIHRLGQHRPIRITRIIIENSIESRILQLQEKKKLLFESTVGKDMDALARLTEDDLKFLFVL